MEPQGYSPPPQPAIPIFVSKLREVVWLSGRQAKHGKAPDDLCFHQRKQNRLMGNVKYNIQWSGINMFTRDFTSLSNAASLNQPRKYIS